MLKKLENTKMAETLFKENQPFFIDSKDNKNPFVTQTERIAQ